MAIMKVVIKVQGKKQATLTLDNDDPIDGAISNILLYRLLQKQKPNIADKFNIKIANEGGFLKSIY